MTAHASPHLAALGHRPRPTSGAAIGEARRYCAAVLVDAGFVISEEEFEYSQFPGAWATPLAGVVFAAGLTGLATARAPGAMAAWAVVLAGLAALAAYTARAGVLGFPLLRRRGVNLVATRGAEGRAAPAVWLVAHLDSKWQPVSMIARVGGVLATSVAALGVLAIAVAAAAGHIVPPAVTIAVLAVLWTGALPLLLSVVGARNHGTLDNASGVAAVLEAASLVPRSMALGVAITDAEELGLAGARAWARRRAPGVALNCDSIDDGGPLVVMYTRSAPRALLDAITAAADDAAEALRVLRLIPGILTDSVALADAGWRTVTLSRGSARTLMRIHTSRDTMAHMDGRGIAGAARVLASSAIALDAEERS